MKQLALFFICLLPFCVSAQKKILGKVASLASYRPTFNAYVDIDYKVSKKSKRVKRYHTPAVSHRLKSAGIRKSCACRKHGKRHRVRSKSNLRVLVNVSFHSGNIANK